MPAAVAALRAGAVDAVEIDAGLEDLRAAEAAAVAVAESRARAEANRRPPRGWTAVG